MVNSIDRFNALDGIKTYRGQLRNILNQAKKEGRTDIANRISKLLKENPNYKEFLLSITDKAFGEIESNLSGLVQLDLDESEGLGKAVSPNEIYQYITDMVIDLVEKKTVAKWSNPMSKNYKGVGSLATNFVSKKQYRGINSMMLNFIHPAQRESDFENPYFLTFKQITAKKGKLKKGSKGYRVIYFAKVISKKEKEEAEEDGVEPRGFPILKYYIVFNGEDIEGIDWKLKEIEPKTNSEKLEVAQLIIDNMPKSPLFKHANNGAFYLPSLDVVNIPPIGVFDSKENYYSVFFHELIHSTKHKTRLNDNDRGGKTGSQEYAKEELVAELGAVFLSAEAGNLISTINNSAAYLKGWKSQLLKSLRADNKFFFRASSKAQAATDYILDRDKEGVPAYLKTILKEDKKPKTNTKTRQMALFGIDKTMSLEDLKDVLGGRIWEKGDIKRLYLDKGFNTRKMKTTAYIFKNKNNDFIVNVYINAPSQHYNWIASQQEKVQESIEESLAKYTNETVFVVEDNKGNLIDINGKVDEDKDFADNAHVYKSDAQEVIDDYGDSKTMEIKEIKNPFSKANREKPQSSKLELKSKSRRRRLRILKLSK